MAETAWATFFSRAVREALKPETRVLDIGAGLRVDPTRGNRLDPRRAWITPYLNHVRYEVLDPVDTYRPNLVGDIQALPLNADVYDAVICLAVLEHVARPWEGVHEMRRVLKHGGFLFVYVPFLIPYHAEVGYYSDFWRFTDDGIRALLSEFDDVCLQAVRGPAETLAYMLPKPVHNGFFDWIGRQVDRVRGGSGKQASGFFVTARKR